MTLLFRKLGYNNVRNVIHKHNDAQVLVVACRKLSVVPSVYDGEQDPAPKFFSSNVQVLLKRLTRPDVNKVFRKRTNSGLPVLKTPMYKFLTNEELEAEIVKANETAERLLQMPPVVKDPALVGYDSATFLFTDITFGVDNQHRIIVQRSTRHFGPLAFYLTWHHSIDNLMLELLQSGAVREAVLLTALRHAVHDDILPTPVQLTKPEQLTEEDITLDKKCEECIEKYIVSNSAMKSQQELALQGFREHYQQLVELSRGLQKAHGQL
ncbi:Mitochondrial ribosomal protein S22 [Operophtera brumata]|uniref:Mitochondrial ribosomal protein S22 n=1 Tax=Operophtera brumata TaxID=104452 RepID=A0A0L7LEX3_OPEBR|nr:Mitochondrial ribosomal protein S22 [Operophtera brumata]